MTYTVAGTKPIYISTWEFEGLTFHIHRPVEPSGIITREGWQFSLDGVPITRSKQQHKAQAISEFKKKCKKWGLKGDVFQNYVYQIHAMNEAVYEGREPKTTKLLLV